MVGREVNWTHSIAGYATETTARALLDAGLDVPPEAIPPGVIHSED
jgi:hypothetical protein